MSTKKRVGVIVVANGISRLEVDRLRAEDPQLVASRNADGTYRVTRALEPRP